MDKYKGKIYLLIFTVTAGILAWGAWNNYKPQVIYASCADIAQKTTNLQKRTEVYQFDTEDNYEQNLNQCLLEAGYYSKK